MISPAGVILGLIIIIFIYLAYKGAHYTVVKEGLSNTPSCANLPGGAPCAYASYSWGSGQKCGTWYNGSLGKALSVGHYTGSGTGWTAGITCPPSSCYSTGGLPSNPRATCMLPAKSPNPQCSSYSCKTGTYQPSPTKICASTTCTPEECCDDEAQCSSHTCPSKQHVLAPQTYCASATCTDDKCCTSNAACSQFKDCPTGTHVDTSASPAAPPPPPTPSLLRPNAVVNIENKTPGANDGQWMGFGGQNLLLEPPDATSGRGKWKLVSTPDLGGGGVWKIENQWNCPGERRCGEMVGFGGPEGYNVGLSMGHSAEAFSWRFVPVDGSNDTYYIESRWGCGSRSCPGCIDSRCGEYLTTDGTNIALTSKLSGHGNVSLSRAQWRLVTPGGSGEAAAPPPSQNVCDAGACTPQECCISNPTCGTFTDCGDGTHVGSPEKVCNETTCTADDCCSANPTCSSFTKCGIGKHIMTPTTICQTNTCTEDECCGDNAKCSTIQCDKKHSPRNPNKICDKETCTNDECCIPNPTCATFNCGSGSTIKSGPAGITCIGIPCENQECCISNAKCDSYECHSGQSLKKNAEGHVCKALDCTNKECCGDNPKCSTHTCESSYYTIKTLLSNAADVTCGGPKCSDAECCDLKPSGKLPKIQTWPIF